MVCGNGQIEGDDYEETFAPVAKMTTVHTFLQIASSRNLEVHQMDVHSAFLHGDLKEEVYMRPPPGFSGSDKNKVCRLKKSLYGLKHAPRCWFEKLSSSLLAYGFTQSLSDYSLFIMDRGADYIQVLVYVDDLVVFASTTSLLCSFKAYMNQCFHMKDLGVSKYFLGLELARCPTGIYLCQRKYALDIIEQTGLLASKPTSFPVEQNHKLAIDRGPDFKDVAEYRRLVGHLNCLAVTRPDLAYSVHLLAQFMQKPKLAHWDAALRVVRYLKGNPGQGILLRAHTDLTLSAWCDSDWQVVLLLDDLLLDGLLLLEVHLYRGKHRSKTVFLAPAVRQNIAPCPTPFKSFSGFEICFARLAFILPLRFLCIVTANLQFIWQLIRYFMNARSM